MAKAWKISNFILSLRLDFHMADNLSITDHALSMPLLISLSSKRKKKSGAANTPEEKAFTYFHGNYNGYSEHNNTIG